MEIAIIVGAIIVLYLFKTGQASVSPPVNRNTPINNIVPNNVPIILPRTIPVPNVTVSLPQTIPVLNINPNPIPVSSAVNPIHLIAGANLLTDQQLAQMEADSINDRFGGSTSKKADFIHSLLTFCLPQEIIADPALASQCGRAFSQPPPLALTIGKGGSLLLGTAAGIGGALGGTFGSAAGFAGTGFAASGTVLGTAIPIAGLVIGPALAIFGAIQQHHAAAVSTEHNDECKYIPAANQSLQVIEQAVTNGQISISTANAMLNQLYLDFQNAWNSSGLAKIKDAAGSFNAGGYYKHFLHAIILKKQNRYATMTAS